jgi:hypothetical protein
VSLSAGSATTLCVFDDKDVKDVADQIVERQMRCLVVLDREKRQGGS